MHSLFLSINKKINQWSFQKKLFICYSIVIFLLFSVAAIFVFIFSYNTLYQKAEDNAKIVLKDVSDKLNNMFGDMNLLATQTLLNTDLQTFAFDASQNVNTGKNFYDTDYTAHKKVGNILLSINSYNKNAYRIGIFDKVGGYISTNPDITSYSVIKNNIDKLSEKYSLFSDQKSFVFLPPHRDMWSDKQSPPLVVSILRRIYLAQYNCFSEAYVEVQNSYKLIENICAIDPNGNLEIIVLDRSGNAIYPGNFSNQEKINHYLSLGKSGNHIQERPWDGIEELVYSKSLKESGWMVYVTIPKSSFMHPVYYLLTIITLLFVLFISISLILVFYITKSLTAPIIDIRKKLKKLTLDDPQIIIDGDYGNNEVNLLAAAFEKTISRLKESVLQTVKARTGELHAYQLALQAQINPHFIYNTLMCISASTRKECNTEAYEMCLQLSDMMRYISSFSGGYVSLSDEIVHTKNYLQLMKWRYRDLLEYAIVLPDEMSEISIPRLSIQPIVENCFNHAFKNVRPPFTVNIKGTINKDRWMLEIIDNGCGFDPSIIDQTNSQLENYQSKIDEGSLFKNSEIGGMGLLNVILRLKLLYGENTHFHIESKPLDGTVISLGGLIK